MQSLPVNKAGLQTQPELFGRLRAHDIRARLPAQQVACNQFDGQAEFKRVAAAVFNR